jgi:hypothetical protein
MSEAEEPGERLALGDGAEAVSANSPVTPLIL